MTDQSNVQLYLEVQKNIEKYRKIKFCTYALYIESIKHKFLHEKWRT